MGKVTEQFAHGKIRLARSRERTHADGFIRELFRDFIELKGDRLGGEDPAVVGGIAFFHDIPVTVIGHRKGSTAEENIKYNFGMASPEGYRKSLRLMKQAERFDRPVITLIDTPGAYPGMEAETNGQSNAIAENLAAMSLLKTPVIAVITGEGNSGGALALAVADRVFMLENSVYSILSPEGFASIMWKDPSRADEASEIMKLTAQDLGEYGLIDGIVPEKKLFHNLDALLMRELQYLRSLTAEELVRRRYRKFRTIDGAYRPEEKRKKKEE